MSRMLSPLGYTAFNRPALFGPYPGYEHGAAEQYPDEVAFHAWVPDSTNSRIVRCVALRSPEAAMLARFTSTPSPRNCPFSRVGVSTIVSCDAYSHELWILVTISGSIL